MSKTRIVSISVLALLISVFASVQSDTNRAQAAVTYTWSYNVTNVYNDASLVYSFSSLDASTLYRWQVFTVDDSTGQPDNLITSFDFAGATSTSITFGGNPYDTAAGIALWPENYVGPILVRDYFNSTILGRHYVAQLPGYANSPDSEWFGGGGNTAVNYKQVIGTKNFAGDCENPAYGPINSDGWMHSFNACSVATTYGDYAILHYQINPSYDPTMQADYVELYLIPDSTVSLTFEINDLIDFQTDSWTVPGSNDEAYSFVIINTTGSTLPFIDNTRAISAFGSTDNPMLADLSQGVYNYSRFDSGASWISDGESVWVVTDDTAGREWSITGTGTVSESGTQALTTRAVTPEVWDSYHGFQSVVDSSAGYSDTTIYAFSTSRKFTYSVASAVSDDVTAQWINRASAMNSGLATVAEMQFEVDWVYDIVEFPTLEENINVVLGNTGLDSETGRAAVLMMILFFGMVLTAGFTGLSGNIYAYLIVWTALGSVFMLGGYGTTLVNTVYSIMTIGMWIFAMLIGGVISENQEG